MLHSYPKVAKMPPPLQPIYVHTTYHEDNWVNELKAQPLYRFGALVREGVDQLMLGIRRTFNFVLSKLGDFETLKLYNALYLEDEAALIKLAQKHKHHSAAIKNMIGNLRVKNQKIKQARAKLIEQLDAAFKKSKDQGKPLLILIGEDHLSDSAAFANVLAILASIDKIPIKEIYTETFSSQDLGQTTRACRAIEQIAHKHDIKLVPMDYANCHQTDFIPLECKETEYPQAIDTVSRAGIYLRNMVMADVINLSEEKAAIVVVGAGHLQGLMQETHLTDKFIVLPIRTSKKVPNIHLDSYSQQIDDYLESADVYQFNMDEVIPDSIYNHSPIIFNKARRIHESAKKEDDALHNHRKVQKPEY